MTRWCISPSYLNGYAPLFSSCAMDPGPRIVTCYTYGLEAGYSYSCPDSGFGLLFILCTIVSMSSIMGLFLLFKQIMIETLTLQCTYLQLLKMNFS